MTTETDSRRGSPSPYTLRSGDDETISETVVRAVASVSDRSALGTDGSETPLEPLYETIDPDALDALFRGRTDDPTAPGKVEFVYCGYEVTVERSGAVTVVEQ